MLKKSLSQNLIKDKNLLRKMVSLAGITSDDVVVEIGAGHGDFTKALCEKAGALFSVELDQSFREYLEPLEKEQKNLKVIFGNFLEVPLAGLAGSRKIKVVGNIPYGITGPILFKLIEERNFIESAFLTTQKEIGERAASVSHRRSYGALSVVCQLVGQVKILLNLKPGVFTPPPKVDSIYFSLVFREDSGEIDSSVIQFVRHCFENKRKHLRYALSKYYGQEKIGDLYARMRFESTVRAEEIEPPQYVQMYSILEK